MLSQKSYDQYVLDVQRRDPQVISLLIDIYGEAIYGVILRIVKREDVAQEIFQDTWTKVWQKGDTYQTESGRLFTWILRIARNNSLNYLQSKYAKQAAVNQSDENLVYINDEARTSMQMECCDLVGAIAQLDSKYSFIIDLIYYQGYTHQEISDEYALPIGTVKSRIKIALRELKKIYDFNLSKVVSIATLIGSTLI